MKCFPSSFSVNNYAVSSPTGSMFEDDLYNIDLSLPDKGALLSKAGINISNNLTTVGAGTTLAATHNLKNYSLRRNALGMLGNTRPKFEDAFKIPGAVIQESNEYRFIYKSLLLETIQEYVEAAKGSEKASIGQANILTQGVRSLFTPNMAIQVLGMSENTPLMFVDDISDETFTSSLYKLNMPSENKAGNNSSGEGSNEYVDTTAMNKFVKENSLVTNYNNVAQDFINKLKFTSNEDDADALNGTSMDEGQTEESWASTLKSMGYSEEQVKKEIEARNQRINNAKAVEAKLSKSAEGDASISNTFKAKEIKEIDTDCSIARLIKESNNIGSQTGDNVKYSKKLGVGTFNYSDFMYCKDLGKVSNNHLIVLRRFTVPCSDNLKSINAQELGSARAKLISWFGTDDNKLEDICKYEFHGTWKQLNSQIEEQSSKEDQNTPMASMVNLASPNFRAAVAAGGTGSNNAILNWFANKVHFTAFNRDIHPFSAQNKSNSTSDIYPGNYDRNKVYTPKNTVQDTNIYEGKLVFNQSFTLNFSYKLRAYDNINPRAAFIDLINNITEVTYDRGTFWGGARQINGPSQNRSGWRTANKVIDNVWDSAGTLFKTIFDGDFSAAFNMFTSGIKDLYKSAKDMIENATSGSGSGGIGTKLAQIANNFGIGEMGKGMLKNQLGRPQIYNWQSLLDGGPHGFWHLTVGNPFNPILSIGDLILQSSTITQSGPLGIDDFPTEIKVTVQLKNCKSRDAADIGRMYSGGMNGIGTRRTNNNLEYFADYINNNGANNMGKAKSKAQNQHGW